MNTVFSTLLDFLGHGLMHASAGQIILYTLIVTHVTIASVTIFLHRCQAHRALDLHPLASHFFRFWLWLTTGQVTREWAAIHRKHHAKCETEDDPHSPVVRGIATVLLRGTELYRNEARNRDTIEKFGHGTPDDWIERTVYTPHSAWGVVLMLALDIALFGVVGVSVWAVQMLWIPVMAAGVINGLGHFWGYRNYDCPDASTNLLPWGILIGGEELHNNHHTFGASARLSSKWFEFDIGWMYIRMLAAVRLATVKKVSPHPRLAATPAEVDARTLDRVIAYRYHIMAGYARTLRQAWREERTQIRAAGLGEQVYRSVRRLLQRDPALLPAAQREELSQALALSKTLQTMHDMRIELGAIWERSTLNAEQLKARLQDWCVRAEASGIRALQDFSLRLRSYA